MPFYALTQRAAVLELLFAASVWGLGFPMTVWAMEGIGAFAFCALRFGIAFLVFLPILYRPGTPYNTSQLKAELSRAVLPGLLLGLSVGLQALGMKYTSATKSGFITTLYVLFVPLIQWGVHGKKLSALNGVLVVVALAGTALLSGFHGGSINIGDFLTLACALIFAIQILVIDKLTPKITSDFVFNGAQAFWAFWPCLALTLILEPLNMPPMHGRWIGSMLYLAIISSLLAFMIQVRAQRVLVPFVASMLFLLEGPFAAVFSRFLLDESLAVSQWVGAGLILLSAAATVSQKKGAAHA